MHQTGLVVRYHAHYVRSVVAERDEDGKEKKAGF